MENKIVSKNLNILDALRGLASIYVLVGHARWLLWEGYHEGYKLHPGAYNFVDKVGMYFFSLFQFGHQAVLFFFVLSGFVIHWSVSKRVDKSGKFEIGDYLLRRFKRIYPPLIAAIIFTCFFDRIGLFQNLPIYFSHTQYSSINENIHPVLNWNSLLGNLFFLQTVYTPVWGTNGALWSLMYEWWFYILYIPIGWLFRKHKVATSIFVLLVWILNAEYGVNVLLLKMVINYFIAWYIGVLLADFLMYKTVNIKAPIGYLAVILAVSCLRYYNGIGKDIALAIGIVVFLYFVLTTNKFSYLGKLHKLGGFSYTLYVVHLPLICLLSGYVMHTSGGTLPMHSFYVICGIIVALPFAWALHLITEKPFVTKHKVK